MSFIKKIVDGVAGEEVHVHFQKFSRGNFKNRALIKVKNSSGKFTINTSAEFANELVKLMVEKLGDGKTLVSGAIISTLDLKDKLDFKKIKQFQGVKKYLIEKEFSGLEVLRLLEEFPKAFFALSFKVGDEELKIKPKAPKSGKPGKKDEEPKADFCKLKTKDPAIVKDFIFEAEPGNFKLAEVKHEFIIEKIVIPDKLKDSKDFALIREKSRRQGKILREAVIDGKLMRKEIEFSV